MRMLFNDQGLVVNLAEEIDIDDYAILIGGTIVDMVSGRPSDRHQALMTGEWEVPKDAIHAENVVIENQWREEQMKRIANQLIMIEDENPKAEDGTAKQWRQYRIKVMDWEEGEDPNFPNNKFRPKDPT